MGSHAIGMRINESKFEVFPNTVKRALECDRERECVGVPQLSRAFYFRSRAQLQRCSFERPFGF